MMLSRAELSLPFPPTVNTYWRNVNGVTMISAAGRDYRLTVERVISGRFAEMAFSPTARLRISIFAYPPDKRRRDLDNLLKAPLDAITFAKLWDDDSQLDAISVERGSACKWGRLDCIIQEISHDIS
jgi:crossover junction endodeoxyribonuclease RusA